ncbi:hypothetical protein [Streptomyces sp. SAJ15]|uniref:hypothetical protein n=1 Tax=Streptomyces sp. SAJ15 TaxID=2011095 RepID=UPI001185BA22|nr:hypothetical protein [Streptomyces sp. SAJ15]TVL87373.1 hypothetical protein CD790_33570 [Streptomyces sp. SAJ15]
MTTRRRLPQPAPTAGLDRRRRTLTLNPDTWREATAKAKTEHLTGARVLEILLASYAASHITMTPGPDEEEQDLSRSTVFLADSVVRKAELRRERDTAAPSFSALSRRLLAAYARGDVELNLSATGTA